MSNYIVSDSDLTSVANAIRTKGGTQAQMTWPAGFVSAVQAIPSSAPVTHIYGVSWAYGVDSGHNNQRYLAKSGTRTDDAANFSDPVPSVDGSNGGSPFDTLQPWAGMTVSTDQLAGAFVAIPRFWYKWTKTASYLKLQIADQPAAGFSVSPAHADRGDGKGERATVYIARYKCAGQMGISVSESTPVTGIPRYFVRNLCRYGNDLTGVHITPADYGIFQMDFSMWWTVRMLMLVEYANWDGQEVLGYGCGEDEQTAPASTGTTDSMPYHTGTVQASLDTYGQGIQYRYIEDMWAGCAEWMDGICTDNPNVVSYGSRKIYVQPNPWQCGDFPMAAADLMDDSDANWAEWVAANVDLAAGTTDGDDPSLYFDSTEMQNIGAYCAQYTNYDPATGNLGGKVAVCAAISDTKVLRKQIANYTLENGSELIARTGWFMLCGEKIRGVLNLNTSAMYAEDEEGSEVMSMSDLFVALLGSGSIDAIKIGACMNGWIVDWTIPEQAGLGWAMIPVDGDSDTSEELSVADSARWNNPSFCFGADWGQLRRCGPFFAYSFWPGYADGGIGARLQKLP